MSRLIDRLYGNVNAEQTIVSNFQQDNTEVILKASIQESLEKSGSKEEFEKAFSTDLQKRFPNGKWVTINGSHVFINGGKVIAGLGGFNKEIDKFFDGKKDKNEIKVGDRVKLPSGEMGTVKGVDYKEHEWKGKKENRSTYKVLPDSRKNETNPGAIVNVSHGEIQKEKQQYQDTKETKKEDKQGKGKLEGSEKSLFENAKKKNPKLSEERTIEYRDKIIKYDKGKTESISALAEAIQYAAGDENDKNFFGNNETDANQVINSIIHNANGYENARRVLDVGIGGKIGKLAKEKVDKIDSIKNKFKSLNFDDVSKTLLKNAIEKLELNMDQINTILDKTKSGKVEDVAEAILNHINKDKKPTKKFDKVIEGTKNIKTYSEPKKKQSYHKNDGLDIFRDLAASSSSVSEFMGKVRDVKDVPLEISKKFFNKYGKGKDPQSASEAFMQDVRTDTSGVSDKQAMDSLKERGHKEPTNAMIDKEKRRLASSKETKPPTVAEKEYYQDNKEEIRRILDEDVFMSVREAIEEHKNKKFGDRNKSLPKDKPFKIKYEKFKTGSGDWGEATVTYDKKNFIYNMKTKEGHIEKIGEKDLNKMINNKEYHLINKDKF